MVIFHGYVSLPEGKSWGLGFLRVLRFSVPLRFPGADRATRRGDVQAFFIKGGCRTGTVGATKTVSPLGFQARSLGTSLIYR